MTGYNPADEGAQMSFAKDMSYTDYLSLDPILGAQNCKSDAHDEMLFIIQHQTSELWMRLCLHELSSARTHLAAGDFWRYSLSRGGLDYRLDMRKIAGHGGGHGGVLPGS
mgnify:CR=1 FL=1